MALKIAVIGGGSAYAPGLINALIHQAEAVPGAELALMDIAARELDIVHRLACRMAAASGSDIRITATRDQQEAVSGADYVLTSFRQGGFEARHLDESIPLQFDVIGQETIGPGGFFFAMRTLPVIRSLLEDMQKLASGAVLLNYSNPTQIVAEAVTHFSSIPCISICDQSKDDVRNILNALNMQDAVVELDSVGLNHATWSTHFTINGEDGIELMRRNYDDVLVRSDVSGRVKRQFRLAVEYDRLPNSYMQYYYFREETVAEAQSAPMTRAEAILETLPGYYQHFEEQIAAEVPRLTHVRGGSVFGDMAVEVLLSLITQDGRIHTLNIPNRGAIAGLADDRVVEVPAVIRGKQADPEGSYELPSEGVGLLHMLAQYQWLAADAIWNGDRQRMEHALASNPLVLSLPLARKLLEKIIPLQKEFLFLP
jgi:6-phospho-beta-glucosidase